MELLHYTQIRDKIEADLDLKDEGFIEAKELLGYINEAIDDCEASIHTLYEDYFLTQGAINFVSGTSEYALPANIYANKIRKFLFINGSIKYEISRIRDLRSTMFVDGQDDYGYIITNAENTGSRLKIYPTPRESIALPFFYIRNAKKLTTSESDPNNVCDIPEFVNYVIQHAKARCYEKEGHPNMAQAMDVAQRLRALMVDTLSNMVPDENTKINMDLDFYRDFDYDAYFDLY